jgi:hypothetical protein
MVAGEAASAPGQTVRGSACRAGARGGAAGDGLELGQQLIDDLALLDGGLQQVTQLAAEALHAMSAGERFGILGRHGPARLHRQADASYASNKPATVAAAVSPHCTIRLHRPAVTTGRVTCFAPTGAARSRRALAA